jgi:hypothetical protein
MLILSSPRKEERLARFLLQLLRHDRSHRAKQSVESVVTLPVSRIDMALYLDMSPETVSRIFGRFTRQNVLRMAWRRALEILDRQRLVELSGWDVDAWMDLLQRGTCPRFATKRSPRVLPWSVPRRTRDAPRRVRA